MKSDKIDYEFKAKNGDEYIIELALSVEGKIFNQIFEKAKKKLEKEKDIKVIEKEINYFPIPKMYHALLRTNITSLIRKIEKEINKDNIFILGWNINSCFFVKNNDYWDILINVGGNYVDKR